MFATISSRCDSASTDSIPNIARPSIVDVSMPCSMTRSRRVTLNVSPSRSNCITRSSFGRDAFTPLDVDVDVVAVDAGPKQGVDLVTGVLVGGRDASAADEHVSESTDGIVHRR
ncbi:hypothetical protein [Streptomyces sviceus]|uniref:hypothetical protein n=1 Tax=Streptomyces sviceus TaxID=285530 RepID=UPI0036E60D15